MTLLVDIETAAGEDRFDLRAGHGGTPREACAAGSPHLTV
jgi:hypothetical protein